MEGQGERQHCDQNAVHGELPRTSRFDQLERLCAHHGRHEQNDRVSYLQQDAMPSFERRE